VKDGRVVVFSVRPYWVILNGYIICVKSMNVIPALVKELTCIWNCKTWYYYEAIWFSVCEM